MANQSYLCCGRKHQTYPSFQDEDYSVSEQTIACCNYCVPLLWLAIFRPEDVMVEALKCEGEIVREPAPVVHRNEIAARLQESVPRVEKLFTKEGGLQSIKDCFYKHSTG